MAGMSDLIQQARLMAAVKAYDAGDTETAYRALGIAVPGELDPSQRALNETRTALGQQQYGYNVEANPLRIDGLSLSNQTKEQQLAQREAKFQDELLGKQLSNGKNATDVIYDITEKAVAPRTDVSSMDKKQVEAINAQQKINGTALGNTVLAMLGEYNLPATPENIRKLASAQMAADKIDMGISGPVSKVNMGAILANHAKAIGLGGVVPGDMDNYYAVADSGINALSSPTKDNRMRGVLSVLGTNALKAQGQGDLLNGTFAFLGDRNGPLDNTVMDSLHNYARTKDPNYETNLSMFYGHLPTILETAAKASGFSGAKEMVERIQDQKEPDAVWSKVMQEAYDKYGKLYQRSFNDR
jgi:hypothetical protein